jgi:molecular chaperone GrpE
MDEENKKVDLPAEGDDLQSKLEKAEQERDEYLSGWQRSKADFINYKKEEMKKLEDVARYGTVDLIKDLISVLDNFDLGLRNLEKTGPVEKGVYLIRTQIDDILKKRGLEKISVKPGDAFDPSFAEALSEVESEQPPGMIVQEIEPGYKLYERVIRPARVIISKENN